MDIMYTYILIQLYIICMCFCTLLGHGGYYIASNNLIDTLQTRASG